MLSVAMVPPEGKPDRVDTPPTVPCDMLRRPPVADVEESTCLPRAT